MEDRAKEMRVVVKHLLAAYQVELDPEVEEALTDDLIEMLFTMPVQAALAAMETRGMLSHN